MDEQLAVLIERASRYRSAARTVSDESAKDLLLRLAADYVSLARLLSERPHAIGGVSCASLLLAVTAGRS